ncbi:MAG: F0F1 ATP synthase subunit B [Bacilli bacterium]|jgi:F-type H+-transporting ATPase subunit b
MLGFWLFSNAPFSPEDVINKLLPNGIWPVITQLLATIIMFVIVYKLAYKPVRAMLEKRAASVKNNIDNANRDQKIAANLLVDADTKLNQAKATAQRLVLEAQKDMESARAAALDDIKDQTRRLKLKAEEDIKSAQAQAKDDIRKEMVAIALEASQRVIGRELQKDDNDKIVNDFIKDRMN